MTLYPMKRAKIWWNNLRHKAWVWMAEIVIRVAITPAAYKLKKRPILILIDNCALGDAVTHETVWISTGTKMWGDIPFESGYSARIPVHSPENEQAAYNEVKYLIGIAELAKRSLIIVATSDLLRAERSWQPTGRFLGYGTNDLNVFANVKISDIGETYFDTLGGKEAVAAHLGCIEDEPFHTLKKFYEPNQSFDVWHLHTANIASAYCFLTTDRKFINKTRQAMKRKGFPQLGSLPMLPSELAKQIGLNPIHSFLVSYRNQVWAVRHDLSMPGGKRRAASAYKKRGST
jgi:hypothetical protein